MGPSQRVHRLRTTPSSFGGFHVGLYSAVAVS